MRFFVSPDAFLRILKGILIVTFYFSLTSPVFPAPASQAKSTAEDSVKSKLVPSKGVPGALIPEGSKFSIFADHEQMAVTSPTALTVDEYGKVFVAESWRFNDDRGIDDARRRLFWYLDDIASQTTDDRRKMYEKHFDKYPLSYYTKNSEKINLLKDTDNDGLADEQKTFADGFNDMLDGTAAGIMAHNGDIYFACIPNIWLLKDHNKDDAVDEKLILQDGFGVRVSFSGHDVNGFAWGPDGRLYATIGDRGFNITTKEGRNYSYPGQGAVLRFETDGSNFEVIHTGLRNPKEIAFDQWGHAITVDNNSDQQDMARLVYIVRGSDSGWRMGHQAMHSFHKQIGMEERPINRWMQEHMWDAEKANQVEIVPPIANITRGPSGLAYHPNKGFPKSEADHFFICDYGASPTRSMIHSFSIEPDGASIKLKSIKEFITQITPTDVEFGYDGSLFVSDFQGGWTSHEDGAIYRLQGEGGLNVQEIVQSDFREKTNSDLFDLLEHEDMRVRFRAQFELGERENAFARLYELAHQGKTLRLKLHGLWGLWIQSRKLPATQALKATETLLELTEHQEGEIRAQAFRALGDSSITEQQIVARGIRDSFPKAQQYAAILAGEQKLRNTQEALIELSAKTSDAAPYLRTACIVGMAGAFSEAELTQLSKHESAHTRLCAVAALRRIQGDGLSIFLKDTDFRVRTAAVRAIYDDEIKTLLPALSSMLDQIIEGKDQTDWSAMNHRRFIHAAFRVGGTKNIVRLLKAIQSNFIPLPQRLEALRLLATWENPSPVNQTTGKYSPLAPRSNIEVQAFLKKNLAGLLDKEQEIQARVIQLAKKYKLLIDAKIISQFKNEFIEEKGSAKRNRALLSYLSQTDEVSARELIQKGLESQSSELVFIALDFATQIDPTLALKSTEALLISPQDNLRQKAWKELGKINPTLAREKVTTRLQDANDEADLITQLEFVRLAQSFKDPDIDQLLADWYKKKYDRGDSLGYWTPTFEGGNTQAGEKLFLSNATAQCTRCHHTGPVHEDAQKVGPNLAGIGLKDRRYLLESIIKPSAAIAAGYGFVTVSNKAGEENTGMFRGENDQEIKLDINGSPKSFLKTDLQKIEFAPSAMPSMEGQLNLENVRDLVAYLATLTEPLQDELVTEQQTAVTQNHSSNMANDASSPNGAELYKTCLPCHQANGQGIPGAFPPLANSEWVNGPAENLIKIQLRGLQGPITVNGNEYNSMMPPQATQTDEEIAAVLTYVRSNFGNDAPAVTPEEVAALRSEAGKPMLTVADLIDPSTVVSETKALDTNQAVTTSQTVMPPAGDPPKPSNPIGLPLGIALVSLIWIGASFLIGLAKKS